MYSFLSLKHQQNSIVCQLNNFWLQIDRFGGFFLLFVCFCYFVKTQCIDLNFASLTFLWWFFGGERECVDFFFLMK